MGEVANSVQNLSTYVREQMRKLGIRQKELAKRSGVSESYVSQVFNGRVKPSIRFLRNLEAALELPPGQLFFLVGTPEMDFVRSFFPPDSPKEDLSEITEGERTALISYLRFLRLQSKVDSLSELSIF